MLRTRWLTSLLAALLVSLGVLGYGYAQEIPGGLPAGVASTAAGSGGAETTPATIFGSKLEAWYRPDTGHVSVDGSNNVTQLDDRSGNGHHFDVVSGTPLLTTDGGVPCVDFERGDSDALGRAAAVVTAAPLSMFVVMKAETFPATVEVLSISQGGEATDYFRLYTNATPAAGISAAGAGASTNVSHGASLSTATSYVLFAEHSAANARRLNVNNGTEVTNATSRTPASLDYTTLGARRASGAFTGFVDAKVFEAVILNAAASSDELTAYYVYTTDRFGAP